MFYFIVSRLPIISNVEDGKLFRVFIIGTICYIILHAFLYSGYNEKSEFIKKYRSYFYYMWGADLALTGIIIKIFGGSQDNDDDDEEELNLQYKEVNSVQRMSQDEIKRKLEEIKKYESEMNNQESFQNSSPSPFIKKDQGTKKSIELNKPENNSIVRSKNTEQSNYINQNKSVEKENIQAEKEVKYSDTDIPIYKSIN